MLNKVSKRLLTRGRSGRGKAGQLLFVWLLASLGTLTVLLCLHGKPGDGIVSALALAKPESDFRVTIAPQAQITPSNSIPPRDIVVLFDVSGSMEDQTVCIDCFVRSNYNPDYPNNGYFNPIPYNPNLAGMPNQSIPASQLCVGPVTPWLQSNGAITYSYLTVEAELYSANISDWDLDRRTPGQGFWAIQRGSRGSGFPPDIDRVNEGFYNQGNRAGDPNYQSSNVCNLGINCKIDRGNSLIDDICVDEGNDGPSDNDIVHDCSAYISAHPYQTYRQTPGQTPILNGASYNLDCFKTGPGPFNPDPFHPDGIYSNLCWTNSRTISGAPGYNPFYNPINGPLKDPGPSVAPWVEYDFTPIWTQTTYIWLRAIGGGEQAYTYAGFSPDDLDPDSNGGGPANNLSNWDRVIFWQIDNDEVKIQDGGVEVSPDWRDNRAIPTQWRWVKLGSTPAVSGAQSTLKLYQGSSGYKVDKIIFTNDPNGSAGSPPPAMRRNLNGGTQSNDGFLAFGPPASPGSATREACNRCNPAYGYTVDPSECTCRRNGSESGYGAGQNCAKVTNPTNQLQAQLRTGLYSGIQPLRSIQEEVKNFIYRLDPRSDQVGFVAFSNNVISNPDGRAKLQCLRSKNPSPTNAAACYAKTLIATERQWSVAGTNIAEAMREGLEELGVSVVSNTVGSGCAGGVDDGQACDRGDAVRRILILVTDGSPNHSINGCSSEPGYADYWDGLVGNGSPYFECAAWYAHQAADHGVVVHTVGIGTGVMADFLTTMATGVDPRGGGTPVKMFNAHQCGRYFSAEKSSDLTAAFEQILNQGVDCSSDTLVLTQSDTPDPAAAGDTLTYTLTVANNGLLNVTNVVITDTLDNNVNFVWASDGGVNETGLVTWRVGVISAEQTISRTLVVTVDNVPNGAILTNTIYLTSAEGISDTNIITTNVSNLTLPSNQLIYLPLIFK